MVWPLSRGRFGRIGHASSSSPAHQRNFCRAASRSGRSMPQDDAMLMNLLPEFLLMPMPCLYRLICRYDARMPACSISWQSAAR